MDRPDVSVQADGLFVSSNMPPSQTEKRLAYVFAFGLVAIFFLVSHFADNRPHPIPGFILAFSAAMFVCDIIAAILLFAQFVVLRSLALLAIANGYVLTAFILVPYTMTFPGVFGPGPLIGGLQSTAFLYIVWHTGFLLFVTGYAPLKGANDPVKSFSRRRVPTAIIVSIALTTAVVILAASISVAGEPFLPQTIRPDGLGFTPMNLYAVGSTSVLSAVCALVLLCRRGRSALDLWLTVVVFLYGMDIPLSYYPAPTRFSIGWYSIRAIAFLSSSILVIVLLHEVGALYARLSRAMNAQRAGSAAADRRHGRRHDRARS